MNIFSHLRNTFCVELILNKEECNMRSSEKVYNKVAERCSAYDKKSGKDSLSNMTSDSAKSCLNCKHFASDEHCKLDLYDDIAKNL